MTSTLNKWPILRLLNPEFISKIRMVLVYGTSGSSCLIETKERMIYALGNYIESTGSDDPLFGFPTKIGILCGKNIKTFACRSITPQGGLALTENGEVYVWGFRIHNEIDDVRIPQKIEIGMDKTDFVVDIACGFQQFSALTNNGKVHSWHYNANQLWLKNTNLLPIKLVGISCGAYHSMAVTCDGQVYSWGSNKNGQLGLCENVDNFQMYQVKVLSGIVIEKVVCGHRHTLALSNKGIVYSWGSNTHGQLGVATIKDFNPKPELPCSDKLFVDVAASSSSDISVAMKMGQQIFIWGYCLGQTITVPLLVSVDSIHDAFALYASSGVMHQPFVTDDEIEKEEDDVDIEGTMSIMDHLMAAFDDKDTSDLTIEVQGKPIYVHKAILKIRSAYFKAMFQKNWKENSVSVIRESSISYAAYRAFLKFLYTGKIDGSLPVENAVEVLQLADLSNDDDLKAGYEDVLIGNILTDNTAFFYSVAVQYNATVLKERCIRFAAIHMAEVTKSTSFSELTAETMKNFIIEVVGHEDFTDCIRCTARDSQKAKPDHTKEQINDRYDDDYDEEFYD